jgi:Cu+-exporting ATPase
MTADDVVVVLEGLVLITLLASYFFAPRTAMRAKVDGGRQVVDATGKGGYFPRLSADTGVR